jgi:hypothetical protein
MTMRIKLRQTSFFALGFIACVVLGTLSHEYGHISVAKWFGYETNLHYGSMNWYPSESDNESIEELDLKNGLQLEDERREFMRHALLIHWGGPVQTMLTGSIGLLALFLRKTKRRQAGMALWDWLFVFLTLFWLREVFNLSIQVLKGLFGYGWRPGGDEANISRALGLHSYTFPILFGIIGFIVALFIVFKVVPKRLRIQFIAGGLIGGAAGYFLWMTLLGPVLLP